MTKPRPSAPQTAGAFGQMRREIARSVGGASITGGGGTYADIVKRIRGALMPQQLAVLDDDSQFKSVKCSRRSGKTVSLLAYAVTFALENPDSRIVVGTMTLK